MPAIAPININDGKATPVTHTFEPARTSADTALYEDRSATQYIGYNKITFMLQRPTGPSKVANRNLRVTVRLEIPVLETTGTTDAGISAVPQVSYRPTAELVLTLPERSTVQERKDLRVLMYNLLGTTPVADLIQNYSVPY